METKQLSPPSHLSKILSQVILSRTFNRSSSLASSLVLKEFNITTTNDVSVTDTWHQFSQVKFLTINTDQTGGISGKKVNWLTDKLLLGAVAKEIKKSIRGKYLKSKRLKCSKLVKVLAVLINEPVHIKKKIRHKSSIQVIPGNVNLIKIFRSEFFYCICSIQRRFGLFDESCSCLHTNTLLDSFLILTDTVNVYNISLSIEMFLLTLLTLLALVRLCCWPYWIL